MTEASRQRGSTGLYIADLVIIILFAVSLIGAAFVYFSPDTKKFSITQGNDNDFGFPTWDVAYNFSTDGVFAALNPITVHVIVSLDQNFTARDPNWLADTPNHIWLNFPGAIPTHQVFDSAGDIELEPLLLNKSGTNPIGMFRGSITLTYQGQTGLCAFVSTVFENTVADCSATPQRAPLLSVSSANDFFQYQTSKDTLALTLVVFAFTVILIRDFITGFRDNRWLLKHKR